MTFRQRAGNVSKVHLKLLLINKLNSLILNKILLVSEHYFENFICSLNLDKHFLTSRLLCRFQFAVQTKIIQNSDIFGEKLFFIFEILSRRAMSGAVPCHIRGTTMSYPASTNSTTMRKRRRKDFDQGQDAIRNQLEVTNEI